MEYNKLLDRLNLLVGQAFADHDWDRNLGLVNYSNRPDLCQFQCNGAMVAAKKYGKNPREISQAVVDKLKGHGEFAFVEVAGPGFINMTLTDEVLAQFVGGMSRDDRLGCPESEGSESIVIDYGGANIAKPLHVGHLRSGIIGECLKRLGRHLGHRVIGDVHLGDWGLQMGMVIYEIGARKPDLPYFKDGNEGPFPNEAPVTVEELDEIYPDISGRAKKDEGLMAACREATALLQEGHPGYRALWQHVYNVSVADLKRDYGELGIEFDLWLGESDTRDFYPEFIETLKASGDAFVDEGALIVSVAEEDDDKDMPPLLLTKSDGAVLYGTTDLATIAQRMENSKLDLIMYVVDRRQHVHFEQVFRAARKTGVIGDNTRLEHIGFGTMNGKDGKPFKTRAGGVMKLKDLIKMVTEKAEERIRESKSGAESFNEDEILDIAKLVGVATLKFADLNNHPTTDYVFDLDRFSSFDGRTGPYQLYSAVRMRSILEKADHAGLKPGKLLPSVNPAERALMLKLTEFAGVVHLAYERRSPNLLCEYCHNLGAAFNSFYHENHILREEDTARQASWLTLCATTRRVVETLLEILGISIPNRM